MKKFFGLFLVITFLACNNKADKKVSGNNEPDPTKVNTDPVYNTAVAGKWKPVATTMRDMDEAESKNLLENTTLEFIEDGTFKSMIKEDAKNGTYSYDKKTGMLTTVQGTKEENFTLTWDTGMMILKNEKGSIMMKRIN